jgi:hypothetical protein
MARQSPEAVSQDDAFDILSNARRRYVLYYLRQVDGQVTLSELAENLAAWENDTPPEELTKQQRKRVYVSLYQTHIQKLADAGVVEYDEDSGTVSLASGASQLGKHIAPEDRPHSRMPWPQVYGSVAVFSGLLYALVTLQVGPFAVFSVGAVGLVVVTAFTVLSAVHFLSSRQDSSDVPSGSLIRDGD